jgi:hypothetical protein
MTQNFSTVSLLLTLQIFLTLPLGAQYPAAVQPKQELGVKPPVLTGFVPLTDAELKDGWIALFDGVSLYGWRTVEGKYKVQDGLLASDRNQDDQSGTIRLTSRFGNSVVTGERYLAGGNGNWSPFTFHTESGNQFPAGTPGITLNTGQFRNIKLLPQRTKPLFDGKTLTGWTVKPKSEAKVVDGAIQLTGGSGSLESEGKYADFVLQLEYKTDKPVNSGVFFRCIPGELMNGYECQIFNDPPLEDYKKFIGTDTGGIFRRQAGRNVGAKDGQWNYLTIFARGTQISTWVNGIQVTDWVDNRTPNPNPRKGYRPDAGTIQFQGHDPTTEILFRNIRISE